ncbi:YadA-like family protein [Acinetobacter indicus]|uniref:YadA-like family protein n=1 Tax=Acinetobacter indicus TaxID=756892 RepID=UPI0013641EF9|nr:YadA C-terminal domain-containing protein [Acinetobacter indicus]
MKFQKTLLAVALSISAVAVTAAEVTPVKGKTPVYQYGKTTDIGATDVIYKINDVAYTLTGEGFVKFEGDASEYSNLLRGGLVDSSQVIGVEEEQIISGGYTAETIYAGKWKDTIVFNEGGLTSLNGTITAPEANTEEKISADINVPGYDYLKKSEYQDFTAGNISENSVGVAVVDGVDIYDQDENLVSSVGSGSALTSKGLGLVHEVNTLNPNVLVDLDKGLVTETKITGVETPNQEVKAYGTGTDIKVIEVAGKFYNVGEKGSLTETTDAGGLALIGAGAATGFSDSKTEIKTNQAFVGAQNVKYGESKVSYDNANTITVGNADVGSVLAAGTEYTIGGANANRVETAHSVTTGIIGADQNANNVYGLTVAKTETGKADQFTTVTAAGIETTGDIAFVDAATGSKTSVKGYLEETSKAVDAKVDAALVEVDSRLTQFNSTAARLNSRIDDVEQTAYRGIAIALAAQQQIPNIGAGQFAVFGGVGHYEGETAGALGVASVFADGRTSLSAALGFAGGNEVGGRVGVSYVFGGK